MVESEDTTKESEQRQTQAESYSNGQPASDESLKRDSLKSKFLIVGIGASAGGLEAMEELFTSMTQDTHMAFVVVQHLSPNYESMLSQIIGRYTNMQVHKVKDGITVSPNNVYVTPADKDIIIKDGMLELIERANPRGHRKPIDSFFSSLASDQQELAVGIVLSGTGNDGTQGIYDIKAKGGMAMAQSPESSRYKGMPKSAIETGLVDYILEPAQMLAQLKEYVAQIDTEKPYLSSKKEAMEIIFSELLSQTGLDFSQYKPQTLDRRIMRRMEVNKIDHIKEYVNYLKQHPEEAEALFRDLLIRVTSFFRNPSVFDALKEKVIPHLFEGRSQDEPIRIWVVGCSTGEEAYSIAILLKEHMERLNQTFKVQLFASDIDIRSIEKARKGVYPASIADDVSDERLERFFIYDSENDTYSIVKNIREMLLFSEHNVIKDPPFSNIDLISCRNLLIYMNVEMQNYIIPLFRYSLKPEGYLVLGTSESVREYTNLFSAVDQQSRIFKSRGLKDEFQCSPRVRASFPQSHAKVASKVASQKQQSEKRLHMRELTERDLLDHYAPAAAAVNKNGDILYLHGNANMYLRVPQGEPSNNIVEMAPEGLKQKLKETLQKAVVLKRRAVSSGVWAQVDGKLKAVDLSVRPLQGADDENLFIVVFETVDEPTPEQNERGTPIKHRDFIAGFSDEDVETVEYLREELRTTEEYLRSSNEELEVSNGELRISNEELQSFNEELQSTNEELETSREELESLNEELSSVNSDLRDKIEELANINENISKMLASTGIRMIFVDTELRIQRFTPVITKIIDLVPTDIGRPIGHFATNLSGYNSLTQDIRTVMDTLKPVYREVQSHAKEWYLLAIHPFSSHEKELEGAAVTFVDITPLKQVQEKQRRTLERMAAVIRDSHDAILLQDIEGNIKAWNHSAEKMYGWSEEEALGMNISDIVPEDQKEKALEILYSAIKGDTIVPYQTQRLTKEGNLVNIFLITTSLADKHGEIYAIATTEKVINKSESDGTKA